MPLLRHNDRTLLSISPTKRLTGFFMNTKTSFSRIFFGLGLMTLFIASPLPVRAENVGLGIAAVINEEVISVLDLESRITMILNSSQMKSTPENRARLKPQILRNLIEEKLKLQEASRTGVEVPKADISARLQAIAANNKMTLDQFSNMLMQSGVPISTLSMRIETELAWQTFVGLKLARDIKVSEEDISDELNRIRSNAGKPEYLLAEIFIPVNKPSQDQEAQMLSRRLLQEIQKGASFKTLATNFSRAPSSVSGGDMGWMQANHLVNELENVVRQLKPGQVSMPVRSIGGYYLMLLREIRSSPGLEGGETILKVSQLHVTVANVNDPQVANATAQQLNSITRTASSCPQLESLSGLPGYPFKTSLLSGSMGEISLSTLPKKMQAVLGPLAVGQPSPPLVTGGGLAVMMICERQSEAQDLDKAREKVSRTLKNRRLDIAARRRLNDLRRDAFVDIRQ
ncbi:MAG: hypothetical protein COB59_03665 [Rhodospirillaceae bacterium]|nr:MAG: hypothetical protein COB59_03665 [Rhodospirillaceae bacterium]